MVDLRRFRELPVVALLRDIIRRWWGLELAFADAKGYVLDHSGGQIFPSQNEACRLALFSKEGFRRCNESIRVVKEHLRAGRASAAGETPSAFIHQCHLGFDVVASPIWYGGELLGFVFVGGSVRAEPSPIGRAELLRKVREFAEIGDDSERWIADLPRLTDADLEHLRDLVSAAAAEAVRQAPRFAGSSTAPGLAHPYTEIVGHSPAVRDLVRLLDKIVRSESTVLIHGESGTGKELIARAIHYHGPRAKKPFVVQNCSAFNDNLLESALFGHVRGAFTGAVKDQKGLFEVADGGTFFLDEIGDMSPTLQVKLLRVLQEGTFTPVGGTKPVKVDVRIIAASHKDLPALVARREFREDLFYRVNVLKITVPPLRTRVTDIPILVDHFIRKHRRGRAVVADAAADLPHPTDAAMALLLAYPWPGNIRELENEIERALVLGGDATELGVELLSQRIRDAGPAVGPARVGERELSGTLREVVEAIESEVIVQGLIRTHWNKSQLAKELGISRSYLIHKCVYYGLERKE